MEFFDFLQKLFNQIFNQIFTDSDYAEKILAIIMLLLIAVAVVGLLAIVYFVLYFIYDAIFFKYTYSESKPLKGEVTDMRYTASRTSTHYNGKTTYTTHHPEKNEVWIKTSIEQFHINSSYLYQRVRVDEEVDLIYQEKYRAPRSEPKAKKHYSNRLVSVRNIKGKVIQVNEEK